MRNAKRNEDAADPHSSRTYRNGTKIDVSAAAVAWSWSWINGGAERGEGARWHVGATATTQHNTTIHGKIGDGMSSDRLEMCILIGMAAF